jgi:hypothetical protein
MKLPAAPGYVYADPDTVARLTGRSRFGAQRRALDTLGIPYRQAATGEPLVMVADLSNDAKGRAPSKGPRWERLVKGAK